MPKKTEKTNADQGTEVPNTCQALCETVRPVQSYDIMTPAERIVFHLCAAAVTAALEYWKGSQREKVNENS